MSKIGSLVSFYSPFFFLNACVAALHHPDASSTNMKACDEGGSRWLGRSASLMRGDSAEFGERERCLPSVLKSSGVDQ